MVLLREREVKIIYKTRTERRDCNKKIPLMMIFPGPSMVYHQHTAVVNEGGAVTRNFRNLNETDA